jgi:serine protease Do
VPRAQTPFRDQLGSNFVVADGPTTGLVYTTDGYIITSSFNFVREPALITVALSDGRRLVAELVARDQVRKLAMLKVEATDLVVPQWVSRQDLRVGQWAIALGLGFGGEEASITVGIVSALSRMHDSAIQTDAKLNPSNYGGPLCDLHGRVMGIGVPMAQRPGELAGLELYDAGVGFAVPKDRVDAIAPVLMTGESFYRGWLGIVVDPRSTEAVIIRNVAEPSPLYEAGVVPGDKIIRANGEEVRHFGHLVQAIYMIPAGQPVRLEMERDDGTFELDVLLAKSSDLGPLPSLAEPFDPSAPVQEPDSSELEPAPDPDPEMPNPQEPDSDTPPPSDPG